MKGKEEKRRKFHQGLLQMLYPSPSSPPQQRESSEEPVNNALDFADLVPDEFEKARRFSSSASEEESGCEAQKLSRAQRKRIRRRKMKEAASRRQKIIGPLLPADASDKGTDAGEEIVDEHPPGVRQNAHTPEEVASSTKQNKAKQRRMVKKLARESSTSTFSDMPSSDVGPGPLKETNSREL